MAAAEDKVSCLSSEHFTTNTSVLNPVCNTMAKSIRSAIKKRFRSQKRSDRISVEDQRLARLSARLEARQKAQAIGTTADGDTEAINSSSIQDDLEIAEPMEVEPKKISTSGSRGSARETWKGGRHLAKKRAKSVISDRQRKKKK